jgi:hypothetical protein
MSPSLSHVTTIVPVTATVASPSMSVPVGTATFR